MLKYSIGTKVKLISKRNDELYGCVYNRMLINNMKYAYIVDYEYEYEDVEDVDNGNFTELYIINDDINKKSGDYYEESDLIPYVIYERKLKLKKLNENR